jgi:hypothetical protein
MSDIMTMEQEATELRQTLKAAIDTWPARVVLAVQEFALLEVQRLKPETESDREQDIARGRAAFKRLQEYSGSVHLEIDYKQELLEALDEKYNRTC